MCHIAGILRERSRDLVLRLRYDDGGSRRCCDGFVNARIEVLFWHISVEVGDSHGVENRI